MEYKSLIMNSDDFYNKVSNLLDSADVLMDLDNEKHSPAISSIIDSVSELIKPELPPEVEYKDIFYEDGCWILWLELDGVGIVVNLRE